MLGIVSLLTCVVLLLAALPMWPYNRSWSYRPSGAVSIALAILVMSMLFGFFPGAP